MNRFSWYPVSASFWLLVLGVLYAVGVPGLTFEALRPIFLPLSPFLLLLTAFALAFFHVKKGQPFWWFAAFVFVASMTLEWVGVTTGVPFGVYSYGEMLGPKLAGVPLIIGVNWWLLVWSTGVMSLRMPFHPIIRAGIASALMVFLDLWIEPLAGSLDFWHWQGDGAPIANFLAWWLAGWVFHLVFQLLFSVKNASYDKNPVALGIYVYQCLFFMAINALYLLA
jgi:uncharacterized membrane protein